LMPEADVSVGLPALPRDGCGAPHAFDCVDSAAIPNPYNTTVHASTCMCVPTVKKGVERRMMTDTIATAKSRTG